MAKVKTVDIELGGKNRTMRLDMNAMCGLAENGIELDSLQEHFNGKVKLSVFRMMLWALLLSDAEGRDESNFTPLKVGSWIDSDNMGYCAERLRALLVGGTGETNPNPTNAGDPGSVQ